MAMSEHQGFSRPSDFSFRFEYRASNLPSEDYYEYAIEVAPDGSGEIRYLPDYPQNHPEELVEIFELTPAAMDRIFRMLLVLGLLHAVWMPEEPSHAGGPKQFLQVVSGGRWYDIHGSLSADDAAGLTKLFDTIRAAVPKLVWDKIEQMKAR